LGFLIAQLTSAHAAQYSVVSFICHIQSPFWVIGFAASGQAAREQVQRQRRLSFNSHQETTEMK
jgi:hypothetical protein